MAKPVKIKDSPARRGTFITFEGGEGAGKSSQIRRLAAWLAVEGNPVLVTREPGGSPGAEAVRHVLLSGAAEPLGADMEAILFFAARSDNVETIIKPALADGKVVLCDRYYDSSRVYQGMTGNVAPELIEKLILVACEDAIPDLTLIIDIDAEEGMRRADKRRFAMVTGEAQNPPDRPDRFEKDGLVLHKARRQGFLSIAQAEPQRCAIINGSLDEESVFAEIVAVIRHRLPHLLAGSGRGSIDGKTTGGSHIAG